jgi:pimeloyl-ACP methyl ester carboxylesterase
MGLFARIAPRLVRDIPRARTRVFGRGYQDARLPEDIAGAWLEPLPGPREAAREYQRLMAVEPALARLDVPTLIVWGTGDIFLRRKWAYWLRDTIPGATDVIEIDGARLFFPDERAAELTAALRRLWDTHP